MIWPRLNPPSTTPFPRVSSGVGGRGRRPSESADPLGVRRAGRQRGRNSMVRVSRKYNPGRRPMGYIGQLLLPGAPPGASKTVVFLKGYEGLWISGVSGFAGGSGGRPGVSPGGFRSSPGEVFGPAGDRLGPLFEGKHPPGAPNRTKKSLSASKVPRCGRQTSVFERSFKV